MADLSPDCFAEPWGYIHYYEFKWLQLIHCRVRLYLDEAEARIIMDQVSMDTTCSSGTVDNYLCRTLTAWGSMLDSKKDPVVICESLSHYLEAQASIFIEQNSLSKFFVSF